MSDIDELRIEIDASAQNAEGEIDKLVEKLDGLVTSLGKISGSKAPQGINNVADQAKKTSQSLETIKTKYQDLGKGFQLKGSTAYLEKQIDNLSNSLAKATLKKEELEASGKTDGQMYEYAVRDVIKYQNQIESLKEQIRKITESKSRLDFTISGLDDAEQKIENIQEEIKTIPYSGTKDYGSSVENYVNEYMKGTEKNAQSLSDKLSQLVVPEVKEDNLKKLDSAIVRTEKKLDGLRAKLENGITMGTITESVDDSGYVRMQTQIALTEKELEALQAKRAEVESRSPKSTGTNGFVKLLQNMGSVAKTTASGISKLAKNISIFDRKNKKSSKSLTGGIKTLLKYGLGIRSLYVLFNKLRTGIKEGTKNVMQYSSETNASVTMLKNSLTQLKNASGAMISPLINALAPALNYIIQVCINAANAVNQLISSLTGRSTWIKAKNVVGSYTDSVSDAGKAAKGALAPFDELNNITSQSGGSGSGSGSNGANMFETVDVSSDISNFADKLKKAWETADFTEIGEIVGNKITNALDSIEWGSVYSVAGKFGKGLATFLNGLISPELFGEVGETIAGALNTVIKASLSFANNFDFYDFGASLAQAINDFFYTFDFDDLAESLNSWVDGLGKAIKGFIDTLDKEDIANKLKGFLSGLEIDTIAVVIGAITIKEIGAITLGSGVISSLANGIIGAITDAFTSVSAWLSGQSFANIITGISSSLVGALGVINPGMIGELGIKLEELFRGTIFDTSTWTGLPKKIDDAVMGAIDSIGDTIGKAVLKIFNWDETFAIFDDAKKNFKEGGLNIVLGIGEGIVGALSFLVEPVKNIFDWIWDGICDLFGIHSPAENMKPLGENILLGLVEGVVGAISSVGDALGEIWNTITEWWSKNVKFPDIELPTIGDIKETVESKWQDVKDWWNENANLSEVKVKVEEIKDKVKSKWQDAKDWWNDKKENLSEVKTKVEEVKDKVKSKWQDAKDWWDDKKGNLSTVKAPTVEGITSKVQRIWTNGKDWWDKKRGNLSTVKAPTVEGIKTKLEKMWKKAKEWWDNNVSLGTLKIKLPHISVSWNTKSNGVLAKVFRALGFPGSPEFGVSYYATGGFPEEDGWFRANHGELMGKFDNGRTVVANNKQITDGIAAAVYDGNREMVGVMYQELSETRKQNEILTDLLAKETGISASDIFNSVRQSAKEYKNTTGRPAFGY